MRTFVLDRPVPEDLRGAAIAIGNFDGLHPGHRAVIEAARNTAASKRAWLMATFDPSPRDLFAPDAAPERIHTPLQRTRVLERMGVDGCVLIPFDRDLSQLSAEAFVEKVLVDLLGVGAVSVGFDFRFGRQRMGDIETLDRLGDEHGFSVSVVDAVSDEEGKLSSTRIREALRLGECETARNLLGDWWVIDAVVEDGEKRGRTLGFPTANLRLGRLIQPPYGVYAMFARPAGEGPWRPAVASFGRTPTTGLRDPLLEVHILEFEGDLYGQRIEAAFVKRLRAEEKFDSIEALVTQMKLDRQMAVEALAGAQSPL